MKIKVLLFLMLLGNIPVLAQDFASRFMMDLGRDTSVFCQTISPKMMEKLVSIPTSDSDSPKSKQLLSKLRSARIIQGKNARYYFDKAEKLLHKNQQRFVPLNQATASGNNLVFVRRRKDYIVELVMLNCNPAQKTFTIVNLTGDMDEEFIELLSDKKR